jgi:hypothetical protein
MASALSSSFSETSAAGHLPDSSISNDNQGLFPESACIEAEVVAEELERVQTPFK